MTAHAYYDFFAERKAAEGQMIKMAKAMGVENAASGKDFVKALDNLIASVGWQKFCHPVPGFVLICCHTAYGL